MSSQQKKERLPDTRKGEIFRAKWKRAMFPVTEKLLLLDVRRAQEER